MQYFYGPVPSRRLGFSLGVDLTPRKTCTIDCIYCQLGKTTNKTTRRRWYIDLDQFKKEFKEILKSAPRIEYITLSGSGEPTLHKDIDRVIALLKSLSRNRYPVCVITNSTLLYRKQVRKQLLGADLIIPSLDAADPATFRRINRPKKSITFNKVVSGIYNLRKEFKGKIWLEIMLISRINDTVRQAKKFQKIISRLKPDKVQLNLPVRPSIGNFKPPSEKKIRLLEKYIGKTAEVVCSFTKASRSSMNRDIEKNILAFLKRRPATIADLSKSLGHNISEVSKYLSSLLHEGRIYRTKHNKDIFYHA